SPDRADSFVHGVENALGLPTCTVLRTLEDPTAINLVVDRHGNPVWIFGDDINFPLSWSRLFVTAHLRLSWELGVLPFVHRPRPEASRVIETTRRAALGPGGANAEF